MLNPLNCLRRLYRKASGRASELPFLPNPDDLSDQELREFLEREEPREGASGGGGGGAGAKPCASGALSFTPRRKLLEQFRVLASKKMAAAHPGTPSLRAEDKELGPFECRVLNNYGLKVNSHQEQLPEGLAPDVAIVCLHGFGAAADQFETVFDVILERNSSLAKKRLLIVCPQAREIGGSPAWFPLDPMKWMMQFAQGDAGIARLIRDEPPGLVKGRQEILKCCARVVDLCGFEDYSRFIVAGFSQGAMMANDVGLHLPSRPCAILSLSGIPLIVEQWTERSRREHMKGLKVFVSHGQYDQLLPFQASVWLHGLHNNNGLDATHHPHSGGHDLGGPSDIAALAEYLRKRVEERQAVVAAAVAESAEAACTDETDRDTDEGGGGISIGAPRALRVNEEVVDAQVPSGSDETQASN